MKMNELPKRKTIRLQGYDYSRNGCYFVTVCVKRYSVKNKHEILGEIVNRKSTDIPGEYVGDAHPGVPHTPKMILSEYGLIADEYIKNIEKYYAGIYIDKYVIMPNHIHMIIINKNEMISPGTPGCASPTKSVLAKIINAYKTLTTKQIGFPIWQRSYHDRIIRDEDEYRRTWRYIDDNPARWADDEYYNK